MPWRQTPTTNASPGDIAMSKVEEFHLHPFGWENDPEEERFRLSTLDYLTTTTWTNTAIFFKLTDAEKMLVTDHTR